MDIRFTTYALGVTAASALAAPAAQAATVGYVGQTFNNNEVTEWRTSTTAKTLDLNADNIYGTDGYIAFATSPVGSGFASDYPGTPNFAFTMVNAGGSLTTLSDLPTDLTVSDGWLPLNGAIGADFYGNIDNPLGGDNAVGFALRDTFGGDPDGVFGNVMEFTVGAGTPGAGVAGATMRIGLLLVNDTFTVADFTLAQDVTSGSSSGFIENFAGDFGRTLMMYDITNYNAGDTIEFWLQARDTQSRVGISGVTFDIVVPEPTGFGLLAAGLAFTSFRRRR